MKKSITDKIRYKWHRFIHTIYSSYMCIKYPFLYPRNRFTGLHYNYWKIIEYHRQNYKKAILSYSIKFEDNKSVFNDNDTVEIYGKTLKVMYEVISRKLILIYNGKVIHELDMRLFFDPKHGMPLDFHIDAVYYEKSGHANIKLLPKELNTDSNMAHNIDNSGFVILNDVMHFYNVIINRPLYWKIKILDWIHDNPLQWLHFIPTYTEYDAMEPGWKKAFGKQMLDEIKAELIRVNYLHQYRIIDIKEKYGSLRWDSGGIPENSTLFKITNKYEQMSYDYCLHCGKPTKWVTRGWITYICDDCAHTIRKDGTCEIDYCDPIVDKEEQNESEAEN